MNEVVGVTPGGVLLVVPGPTVRGEGPVEADGERMDCLLAHFARWIGPATQVFHERKSELVHIDVHVIGARPEYPFVTLFTTGMSQRPMPGAPRCVCGKCAQRVELMMTLPCTWELPPPACGCHPGAAPARSVRKRTLIDRMWPVRELFATARYVHRRSTYIDQGHTLPNGNPPRSYGKGTRFCCTLVFPSAIAPPEIASVVGPDGETIHVLALWPLYREEVELKLSRGNDALLERLARSGVSELVDVRRVNAATGRRG